MIRSVIRGESVSLSLQLEGTAGYTVGDATANASAVAGVLSNLCQAVRTVQELCPIHDHTEQAGSEIGDRNNESLTPQGEGLGLFKIG